LTRKPTTNVAASVRARLLNVARERREDYGYVLGRYGVERLLHRLSLSPHADRFVLKGAALFAVWRDEPHRSTQDVDFLGYGDASHEAVRSAFAEVCGQAVDDDGLVFDPDRITVEDTRPEDEYAGLRLKLPATLESARITVQVDIGFGDAVTPEADTIDYPVLLDHPAPKLKAYPRETVVAEKYQAIVKLGMPNSRMKDFYDLWTLAESFEFAGAALAEAIGATFHRRETDLPSDPPIGLTLSFAEDSDKQKQWSAFLRRTGVSSGTELELRDVVARIWDLVGPPTRALRSSDQFAQTWHAGDGWTDP